MPEIKLTNVTKRWGKFFGVDNVSLEIPDNSFITLLDHPAHDRRS